MSIRMFYLGLSAIPFFIISFFFSTSFLSLDRPEWTIYPSHLDVENEIEHFTLLTLFFSISTILYKALAI